jgi:hypothetical protein
MCIYRLANAESHTGLFSRAVVIIKIESRGQIILLDIMN